MTKQNINSKKGFTIIEVVLVLAIAGLIFLMVFIAYPALRRSQADTQRRNDMSSALSQISNYRANNRQAPQSQTEIDKVKTDYLRAQGSKFTDPDGEDYTFKYIACAKTPAAAATATTPAVAASDRCKNQLSNNKSPHQIIYLTHAKCQGEEAYYSAGKNDVVLQYQLEGGGNYCGSSN